MGITLITPTQGNIKALQRTIDSVKDICDEFVIGSVCVFDDDVEKLNELCAVNKKINLEHFGFIEFNYIFKNGFSSILNKLSSIAKNDLILYLNVGEVFESSKEEVLSVINDKYNAYYLDNRHEKHRWFRMYNKKELQWKGIIHEELFGDYRPYRYPIFTFADTEKDLDDSFKSFVYNDIKEITYWSLLMKIADNPDDYPETNDGWKQFAKDTYQSMKERLEAKGSRYKAFLESDYEMYMNDIYDNPEFEKERFESNEQIEFQGSPMYLGKK